VKRAYYADLRDCESDDGDDDVNELLHNVLEPQPDLEEEYDRAQNAYFATRYRDEKGLGFLGTSAAPRVKQTSAQCRNCHEIFPSNNKLHGHLRACHCHAPREPPARDNVGSSPLPRLRRNLLRA
jgi:hypothetical protein